MPPLRPLVFLLGLAPALRAQTLPADTVLARMRAVALRATVADVRVAFPTETFHLRRTDGGYKQAQLPPTPAEDALAAYVPLSLFLVPVVSSAVRLPFGEEGLQNLPGVTATLAEWGGARVWRLSPDEADSEVPRRAEPGTAELFVDAATYRVAGLRVVQTMEDGTRSQAEVYVDSFHAAVALPQRLRVRLHVEGAAPPTADALAGVADLSREGWATMPADARTALAAMLDAPETAMARFFRGEPVELRAPIRVEVGVAPPAGLFDR